MSYGGFSILNSFIFIARLLSCCCFCVHAAAFRVLLPLPPSVKSDLTSYHHVHKTIVSAPPPTYRNRRLNTLLAVLQAKQSLQTDEGKSSRRRQQLRRWRYEFFIHQESHRTAAGAESLFSLSWWPFSCNKTTELAFHKERRYYHVDSVELPSIDCSWACVSNTEKIQLQQMKLLLLLQSEFKMITDMKLNEKYPDVYGDLRLLRFLRRKSKERDVQSVAVAAEAAECYQCFLEWRFKNEVDNIRAMVEDCSGSFTPPDERLQTIAAYFPMRNFENLVQATDGSYCEVGDNSVKPAILVNVGEFDTRGITQKILSASDVDVALEDFLNYWVFLYESIHVRLYKQSIQSGQMSFLDEVVCDLSGMSFKQFFSPLFFTKIMSPWLKSMQANYPETTRRLYILHPPAFIKVVWKLVTPLLSQGTLDKIRFVSKV